MEKDNFAENINNKLVDLLKTKLQVENNIKEMFKEFMKHYDVIRFHKDEDDSPYDEVRIAIRNPWEFERGGDYHTIVRLEYCSDGDVGVVNEWEDVFFLENLDNDAIGYIFNEAICALDYQDDFLNEDE